jgi:CRISPR-associated protein Cas1
MDDAWAKVRSNNGCSGGDGVSITAFQPRAPRRLAEVADELRRRAWRPGPYRMIDVPKKKGGARRLMIPPVEDRIVHTALAQVLSPVLEPQFEECSYAYRPGRSVAQAVAAIGRWQRAGYEHVIEADIVGFFDNMRHDLTLQKLEVALAGHAGGDEIVDLVALILEHQGLESGIQGRGIAQGSPLSPLLANLYLDALDEAIEKRGVRLIRFADDFVVLCKRHKHAAEALENARAVLGEHGLDMHDGGTRIIDFDRGFEFLGHMFVRSFAFRQVSDPQEDPLQLLRDVAGEDASLEQARRNEEAEAKAERTAGYARGERVLYVHEPGRRVVLRNLSFAVENAEGREMVGIAHDRVDRIEIGPAASADPAVYEHCLGTDTELALVNRFGETRGTFQRPLPERGELHLAQAAAVLDPGFGLELARRLVEARIRNQRTQLFRLNRRYENPEVVATLAAMGRQLRKLPGCTEIAQLRGMEGATGALYWPALGLLTEAAPTPFRRSRPGRDPLNATVNYLAAILGRDIGAAVQATGLHPGFGTLHTTRERADACVYDLMEPFRAPLTEGLAAFLFNSRRLRPEMFSRLDGGGVRIGRDAVRAIIKGYEAAVARRVNITGGKGKLAWRPMMRHQARSLIRALKAGDAAPFTPYLMEP